MSFLLPNSAPKNCSVCSAPLHRIQLAGVYSHGLPLWKRLIAATLFDCVSWECRGAKCLQLRPVIAFWVWANDCGRSEYTLIALFSSPSQRSQLRRLESHYSKMSAISRWSGRGNGVHDGVSQPKSTIPFIYCLSIYTVYIAVMVGKVKNVKMNMGFIDAFLTVVQGCFL